MAGRLIFETSLGFVAVAWSERGLTHLALPEPSAKTVSRLASRWGGDVLPNREDTPHFVDDAIHLIRRYAEGEVVDFTRLPLDLSGIDPFCQAIYAVALQLDQGDVTTYGELAARAGFPGRARETGKALGKNPLPLLIPCHRILAAGGKIGGFSAPGGAATKARLLAHEGVRVDPLAPAQASFSF